MRTILRETWLKSSFIDCFRIGVYIQFFVQSMFDIKFVTEYVFLIWLPDGSTNSFLEWIFHFTFVVFMFY